MKLIYFFCDHHLIFRTRLHRNHLADLLEVLLKTVSASSCKFILAGYSDLNKKIKVRGDNISLKTEEQYESRNAPAHATRCRRDRARFIAYQMAFVIQAFAFTNVDR